MGVQRQTRDGCEVGTRRVPARRLLGLLLCLAPLVLWAGCGGCRRDPLEVREEKEKKEAEDRAKKEKAKPKPDFVFPKGLKTRPFGTETTKSSGLWEEWYKPGHWTSVSLDEAKANNFDFVGDLGIWAVDKRQRPIPLVAAPFELATAREVALPKGQPKAFESALYVPPTREDVSPYYELTGRKGGRYEFGGQGAMKRMPSYQYHFVVVARWPERYKYLESLPSVKPPGGSLDDTTSHPYYRVSLMASDRRLGLPSHPLFWTSIAYVLWDDADPGSIDLQQQQALLDWLHWGGQLILSGPDTLDTLRGSFLEPYLPATAAGGRDLSAQDFSELNDSFKAERRLTPARTLSGVQLKIDSQDAHARFVPGAGDLLAERRVGRGRVVVSAFRLSGRELTTWPGWDNAFNACLLGRPPRKYIHDASFLETHLVWADSGDRSARRLSRLDAARTCNLRYFTRDTGVAFKDYGKDVHAQPQDSDMALGRVAIQVESGPGVAAWNDFSEPANRARESLLEAARIEIPPRSFVLWVLAGYLLVLVPVNWAVFRVLGRVEWAWVAAPLIALVCTGTVIRLAQLDIGFARSRSEIAVVEFQGDYPRAHVTRYTALYTSLSTGYDFRFEDPGAVVQPFPDGRRLSDSLRRLEYRLGEEASLSGFSIDSNSVKLVHSEQMLALDGPLALRDDPEGGQRLSNDTQFTFQGAGLVRKNDDGRVQAVWLGALEPGAKVPLIWEPAGSADGPWQRHRDEAVMTAAKAAPGDLNLRGLTNLAEQAKDLAPGEVRLVAWLDRELPALAIRPAAPQTRYGALVVAHLRYGHGPAPRSDVNTRADVDKIPPGKEYE